MDSISGGDEEEVLFPKGKPIKCVCYGLFELQIDFGSLLRVIVPTNAPFSS